MVVQIKTFYTVSQKRLLLLLLPLPVCCGCLLMSSCHHPIPSHPTVLASYRYYLLHHTASYYSIMHPIPVASHMAYGTMGIHAVSLVAAVVSSLRLLYDGRDLKKQQQKNKLIETTASILIDSCLNYTNVFHLWRALILLDCKKWKL